MTAIEARAFDRPGGIADPQPEDPARAPADEASQQIDPALDRLAAADDLADSLVAWARAEGVPAVDATDVLMTLTERLIAAPPTSKPEPPEVASRPDRPVSHPLEVEPVTGTHGFFDVVRARASRRDFGTDALDQARLISLLQHTFGTRDTVMAYNYRDVPLRYVPTAGGLNSVEPYVIVANVEGLEPGAYVFDGTAGLRHVASGWMIDRLAASGAGAEWVAHAAADIVLVSNVDRLRWKYTAMTHKLALLDVGVCAGHMSLVATALELRSTIVGNVDAELVTEMLELDPLRQRPLSTVVIGTRGRAWGW